MNINEKITKYREEAGFNKSELARMMKVSPAYITMIENGTKTPSHEFIMKLSYVLNVKPEDIDVNFPIDTYLDVLNHFNSLNRNNESENITSILKNEIIQGYMSGDEYKRELFHFYEELAQANQSDLQFDRVIEKILCVGLDNFQKILPKKNLRLLRSALQLLNFFNEIANTNSEKEFKSILNLLNLELNFSEYANIPKNKELKLNISIVDKNSI